MLFRSYYLVQWYYIIYKEGERMDRTFQQALQKHARTMLKEAANLKGAIDTTVKSLEQVSKPPALTPQSQPKPDINETQKLKLPKAKVEGVQPLFKPAIKDNNPYRPK